MDAPWTHAHIADSSLRLSAPSTHTLPLMSPPRLDAPFTYLRPAPSSPNLADTLTHAFPAGSSLHWLLPLPATLQPDMPHTHPTLATPAKTSPRVDALSSHALSVMSFPGLHVPSIYALPAHSSPWLAARSLVHAPLDNSSP